MEKKIAIDIVLFLPDDVNKIICYLSNKIIPPKDTKPYVLDNKNYFPHVSLLMGTVLENEIESIKEKLEPIFKKYLPLQINFTEISIYEGYPYLAIEKTKELIDFQGEILNTIYLGSDSIKEMFFDQDVPESAVDFVNNYRKNKLNVENRELHVALGLGDAHLLDVNLPIKTTIKTMAICHLGYSCSCRKVLAKVISE